MSLVFISYRRSDSKHFTGRMYDKLRTVLGRDKVFKDVDSIPAGSVFPTVLGERLQQCRVALIIIGKDWLNAKEDDGTRRLDNPNDFVRIEVETVLNRRIPVIPVLVDGAALPETRDLPASLHGLTDRHALKVEEDPRFDTDMDRLTRNVQWHLAGDASKELTVLPKRSGADAADDPTPPVEPRPSWGGEPVTDPALTFRDLAWQHIARRVAKRNFCVVLTGAAELEKRTTAVAFARWHTRDVEPLVLDAVKEFYDLSLIEEVGRRYKELYQDHDGVPFVSQPFGTQRQLAIDLLVRRRVVVIIDNPGLAEYPRNPRAEAELAIQLATELARKSILVIVTVEQATGWEEYRPIPLEGLSPEGARELVKRELESQDVFSTLDDLATSVGGTAELDKLIARGIPGELKRVARGVAVEVRSKPSRLTSVFIQLGRAIRHVVLSLLGDPVMPPRSTKNGESGLAQLFVVSVGLLLLASLALIWSYESGSQLWERMFYGVAMRESEVPPLPAVATKVSPGPGLLIEVARAMIVIIFFFLVVIGRFFAPELTALLPHAPWAKLGPRTLGLRSVFRLVFLALAIWLGISTVVHHLYTAPRTLWMCNGNPFLQKYLEANDIAKIRELQSRKSDDPNKMNEEPPSPGANGYEEYWRQCVLPYRRYFTYSFVMFVLVGPTVLTVCFYSVCSSLWTHLTLQPKRVEQLDDQTPLQEIENRIRYYKTTYAANIDKYLLLVLIILCCWAYHLWLDRYNLTESAHAHTTRIIIVALMAWIGLFAALLLAYQVLVRQAAARFPEGAPRDKFERRHSSFQFFWRTVTGSTYTWLCLLPLVISGAWYVAMIIGEWQR